MRVGRHVRKLGLTSSFDARRMNDRNACVYWQVSMSTTQRGIDLNSAARELGVSRITLRRWIQAGAPVIRPGRPGPGKGTLVLPDALRRWRAREVQEPQDSIARGIANAYGRAPEGYSQPAWAELGLSHRQAAALLIEAYREIVRTATGRYPETLPTELSLLGSVFDPNL